MTAANSFNKWHAKELRIITRNYVYCMVVTIIPLLPPTLSDPSFTFSHATYQLLYLWPLRGGRSRASKTLFHFHSPLSFTLYPPPFSLPQPHRLRELSFLTSHTFLTFIISWNQGGFFRHHLSLSLSKSFPPLFFLSLLTYLCYLLHLFFYLSIPFIQLCISSAHRQRRTAASSRFSALV